MAIEACADGGQLIIDAREVIDITGQEEGAKNGPPGFRMIVYGGNKMFPGGWKKDYPLVLDVKGMTKRNNVPALRDHKTT